MTEVNMSLEMVKSIMTSVVVVLALVQALEMAQIRGYVRLLPFDKRVLRKLHRRGGIATLVLMLVVAVICLVGEGYALYTLRVCTHVVLGVLSLLILAAKVTITHRFRHYLRFNTGLGVAVGVSILGTFASSALWYFVLRW
jgi:hypothetical protein